MNEKFKTLVIVALSLMLLGTALHVLFVKNLKSRLFTEHINYELAEFSTKDPASETAETDAQLDEQLILTLENRLKLINVFKFVFLISGAILFIIAWFFREQNNDDFEDEWDEEEWEDENDLP